MLHGNERLRLKCIPYLFFTTSTQPLRLLWTNLFSLEVVLCSIFLSFYP
jgi:hypothetical protein